MRRSLILLILAAALFGIGIGWWVHPGAGLASSAILLGLVALFHDDDDGKARP